VFHFEIDVGTFELFGLGGRHFEQCVLERPQLD
jgi:hypothetical protein